MSRIRVNCEKRETPKTQTVINENGHKRKTPRTQIIKTQNHFFSNIIIIMSEANPPKT